MSLTAEFYASLEELLDQAFADAPDESIHGCFCDGVLAPEWEPDYLASHIKMTKQIIVRAWIDEERRIKAQRSTSIRLYSSWAPKRLLPT